MLSNDMVKEKLGSEGVKYVKEILDNDESVKSNLGWFIGSYVIIMTIIFVLTIMTNNNNLGNIGVFMIVLLPILSYFSFANRYVGALKKNEKPNKKYLRLLFGFLSKNPSFLKRVRFIVISISLLLSIFSLIYLGYWFTLFLFLFLFGGVLFLINGTKNEIQKKYIEKIKEELMNNNV